MTRADVVFLAVDWQTRTLIRAQLLEQGIEVVAVDTWTEMRGHLRPRGKPKAVLVDLKDLPDPLAVLRDLRLLMKPERVIVLSAIGTVAGSEVEGLGFRAIARPFAVDDVARAV